MSYKRKNLNRFLDEHYKKNKDVCLELESAFHEPEIAPLIWLHEVNTIEDGIYKPVGLLKLPFSAYNYDDGMELFTYFDRRFFDGSGIANPEFQFSQGALGRCMDIMSWGYHDEGELKNVISIKAFQPDAEYLTGINNLIEQYFKIRHTLENNLGITNKSVINNESKELFMDCFKKYEGGK